MRTKKSIRRAFEAAMPDVLHQVMEDCPAVKAKEPSPVPASAPMMPHNHWFKELVATAVALAILIGVAAGGVMFLRDPNALHAGSNPTDPTTLADPTDPNDVIGVVPMAVPASVRSEILTMLGITEGAELEIVPSLRGEYYAYAVGHEGFAYSFVFDSFDEFVSVEIVTATGESILPPLIAKQLLQQHLNASVDTEQTDPLMGPSVVTDGELVELDVGIYYQFMVSPHPYMSSLRGYYVDALNGQVHITLPEQETPPVEAPWDLITARDKALLAVHLSMDEVYYLHGGFPPNEDGAYYIRWWFKTENSVFMIPQSKDYQAMEIIGSENVNDFADVPDEWYPWQKARTIALEDAGVRLEDVTALDCSYSHNDAWYSILFTVSDTDYAYTISAKDGSIIDGGPVSAGQQYVGEEFALDLVTRQSELPQALRDAMTSGDAGVVCTLSRGVYSVELHWKDDTYSYNCYAQVNAVTGELLSLRADTTPHEFPVPPSLKLNASNVAEHVIIDLFGYTMDEAHVLGVDVYPEHFVVTFVAAGCRYEVTVDAVSGEMISHTAEDQYDALEEFNQLFGDQTSYYNWALVDLYRDVTQLNLQTLFANAKADGWAMADVEWHDEWYNGLSETDKHLDHNFVPRELMDQVLQEYFGIRLEDLPEESYYGLTYIDLIGWYSVVASDYSAVEQFRAVGLEERENGEIWLYYTCDGSNDLRVVSLRLSRNSNVPWQIVFNAEYIPYLMYSTTTAESIPN